MLVFADIFLPPSGVWPQWNAPGTLSLLYQQDQHANSVFTESDMWDVQLAGKLYMEAIEAVEDDGKEGLSGDMYRQAIGMPHSLVLSNATFDWFIVVNF